MSASTDFVLWIARYFVASVEEIRKFQHRGAVETINTFHLAARSLAAFLIHTGTELHIYYAVLTLYLGSKVNVNQLIRDVNKIVRRGSVVSKIHCIL